MTPDCALRPHGAARARHRRRRRARARDRRGTRRCGRAGRRARPLGGGGRGGRPRRRDRDPGRPLRSSASSGAVSTEAVESLGGLDVLVASHGTLHAGPALELIPRGLGRHDRGQPHLRLRALPARRRADGAARGRQDRHDRVDAELPGWIPRGRLQRLEGRRRPAHEGARERVGAARSQRQRDRAGVREDRRSTATSGGTTPRGASRSSRACRRDAGASRPTSRARPSSSRPPPSDYVHGIVLPVDGGWLGR